jgi:hypothetical protein
MFCRKGTTFSIPYRHKVLSGKKVTGADSELHPFDLHGDFEMITISAEELLSDSFELEAQFDDWVIVDEVDEGEGDGLNWR